MDYKSKPEYMQNKQKFANFLNPDNDQQFSVVYQDAIADLLQKHDRILEIDLSDVSKFDQQWRRDVLRRPMDFIPAWEEALKEHIERHPDFSKEHSNLSFKISFRGPFGSHNLTPQELMADSVGKMVAVEGIVTKVSLVKPKVVETVHYCESTGDYTTQTYYDKTSITGDVVKQSQFASYPTTDVNGNKLTTEFGLSTYMDFQTCYIQDMPERTKAGCMPQSVECLLNDCLVDECKPGDRVKMIGIYRALGGRSKGQTTGRFRTVLLVNNVIKLNARSQLSDVTQREKQEMRAISQRKDVFDLISRSIVPSIYGHEFIKKGITLLLFGGCEKVLSNGTHMRGDVNILMVGDPSCGKSQLLRAVMNIAPLAINTTGRGSSGVGLTAAITTDKGGERRLEAGAMVLADRGIVCIDEFDKMSDIDRTAIHEVMEQQTVTISKAGIQTSLNARCSVMAAANPVYGMYDRSKKPNVNIGLPDSLLSRFDLLFIVLDKIDTKVDRNISDHVLAMHCTPSDYKERDDDDDDDGGRRRGGGVFNREMERLHRKEFLNVEFCKKYIQVVKAQVEPKLTSEACAVMGEQYADLRNVERNQTLPITARCLESIIRLSTAHAKLRMSSAVEVVDVEQAFAVLNYALTNDADPQKGMAMEEDSDDDDDDEDEQGGGVLGEDVEMKDSTQRESRKRGRKSSVRSNREEEKSQPSQKRSKKMKVSALDIKKVSKFLSDCFRAKRDSVIKMSEFMEAAKKKMPGTDVLGVLEHLNSLDRIFFNEENIHRI